MTEDQDKRPPTGAAGTPANDHDGDPRGERAEDGGFFDPSTVESPGERLAALEAELADTRERLLRALAETENTRRRFQREREDTQKYAVSSFAKDLLSVADNLRRALEAIPESEVADPRTKSLLDGVRATERELSAAFERHGLRRIDPKGEAFDHNFHQAIFEAERPDAPAGTVVEVLQPGYVLHDRLLRPAMVGVAKAGPRVEE